MINESICSLKKIEALYNKLLDDYDKLKEENEALKIQLMQKSEVDMFFNTPLEGWSNDPCEVCRYKQTLQEIYKIIIEFSKQDIITFPDFTREQNYKAIQKQCGAPIIDILNKCNEVMNENQNS